MATLLNTVQHHFARLLTVSALAAAVSIIAFVVLIPLDFALRLCGWGSLPWLNEVLEYSLYISVMLAAPWLLRCNGHVRLDVADQVLPSDIARYVSSIADFVGAMVCFTMAWFGTEAAVEAFTTGTRQYKVLTVDVWWLLALFAASMTLLSLEFVFRLLRA